MTWQNGDEADVSAVSRASAEPKKGSGGGQARTATTLSQGRSLKISALAFAVWHPKSAQRRISHRTENLRRGKR